MKKTWLGLALCALLGYSAQLHAVTNLLEARIIDDLNNEPLAARVAITNPDGKFIEIHGKHAHVQYLDKRWCYVDGGFALAIPDSGVQIEIRRGFETRPFSAALAGKGTGKIIQKTFRLKRWIDMRQKGYFSGDIHAHLPVPREAHPQMRAEDLNALTLLHMADTQYQLPVNDCFTGRLDTNSTPGCDIFVSQEIRDFQMGHLTLLDLTRLVPGYPDMGGSLEYWRHTPHWDLARAARAAHAQNGLVFWSHFCSLPGVESPIAIALGLVDGIELITWNDPTQFPNHWWPWQHSGKSQAEFPIMRPVDLYYQYLNCGFRLPIAAGTDKFNEVIPLGSNRVYARVQVPTYASWLAGVKSGKAFVSNGPILEFQADGRELGDVVPFQGTKRVKARVTARSILPFTTLEIVSNGETVGHKTVVAPSAPPAGGVYSMDLETTVELKRSSWLAARVVEHPDLRSRILPRGLSVFAHTNPIYFLQNGNKVREPASLAYVIKYVEAAQHWLGTNPPFVNQADLQDARRYAEEALQFYKRL